MKPPPAATCGAHREPPFEPPPSPVPDPAEPPAPDPMEAPMPPDPHPVCRVGRPHRCARRGHECLPRAFGPARGPLAGHHAHVRAALGH